MYKTSMKDISTLSYHIVSGDYFYEGPGGLIGIDNFVHFGMFEPLELEKLVKDQEDTLRIYPNGCYFECCGTEVKVHFDGKYLVWDEVVELPHDYARSLSAREVDKKEFSDKFIQQPISSVKHLSSDYRNELPKVGVPLPLYFDIEQIRALISSVREANKLLVYLPQE